MKQRFDDLWDQWMGSYVLPEEYDGDVEADILDMWDNEPDTNHDVMWDAITQIKEELS